MQSLLHRLRMMNRYFERKTFEDSVEEIAQKDVKQAKNSKIMYLIQFKYKKIFAVTFLDPYYCLFRLCIP